MAVAMPVVIINMGGEMVYILEQRLEAQKVPKEKGLRVLGDVTRTMYNEGFVNELFKPQDIYSVSSVRQIFDRLAHSSIMRLNEASMDKLFDLMLMGFKYQLMCCTFPGELLDVTRNHLSSLASKVTDQSVAQLVANVSNRVQQVYGQMGPGEWGRLRRALCTFFQDRKVKVSLFLQDGIQRNDGTIAVSPQGVLPPGANAPGATTYFDVSQAERAKEHFHHPLTDVVQPRQLSGGQMCELGINLYSKERTGASGSGHGGGSQSPPTLPQASVVQPTAVRDSSNKAIEILAGDKAAQARQELNLLASLVTTEAAPSAPFKINLFPDAPTDDASSAQPGKVHTIVIDSNGATASAEENGALESLVAGMSIAESAQDDSDDLLALMDRAGQ